MLSHTVGIKGGANKDRTCLFRYIGVQRVARILTGKSHAFAVLHREIRFKFGSVGCSGDWTNGAVECLPFTASQRAASWDAVRAPAQGLMIVSAPSLALGPKASPLYWSLLCHADLLVLPTAHLWWGRHSRQSGGLASRLFAFKGCPLPPTPFPPSFLSTWWQAPLPNSQRLDFPENLQSSKQALFVAPFVWAHAFFLCHRIPFLYSFVR